MDGQPVSLDQLPQPPPGRPVALRVGGGSVEVEIRVVITPPARVIVEPARVLVQYGEERRAIPREEVMAVRHVPKRGALTDAHVEFETPTHRLRMWAGRAEQDLAWAADVLTRVLGVPQATASVNSDKPWVSIHSIPRSMFHLLAGVLLVVSIMVGGMALRDWQRTGQIAWQAVVIVGFLGAFVPPILLARPTKAANAFIGAGRIDAAALREATSAVRGGIAWHAPEPLIELGYLATRRALVFQSCRILVYTVVAYAITLAILRSASNPMPPALLAGVFAVMFLPMTLSPLLHRRPKRPTSYSVDDDGVHLPVRERPLRQWKWFRGYDVDPHPLDHHYARLRLLRKEKGRLPLELPLPEDKAEAERVVQAVERRLPRAFAGVRDRGPVDGWMLGIGLALALVYGVALGQWAAAHMGDWSALMREHAAVGPFIACAALFVVGPGVPWALVVSNLRPRRTARHYVMLAAMVNMLGNMVLILAAGVRILPP